MALPKEYDAIERALRVARSRSPSNEGSRALPMWDEYQADREPYGNRPWRKTPYEDRLTEKEIRDLSDILGMDKNDIKAALAERNLNFGGATLEENAGWMNHGRTLGLLANHAEMLGKNFSNIGKDIGFGYRNQPEKAAQAPVEEPVSPPVQAVPSVPPSLEEVGAMLGRAQMEQANYNPRGVTAEEIGIDPAAIAENARMADIENSQTTARAAMEDQARLAAMFTQEAPLTAALTPLGQPQAQPQFTAIDRLGMFANPNVNVELAPAYVAEENAPAFQGMQFSPVGPNIGIADDPTALGTAIAAAMAENESGMSPSPGGMGYGSQNNAATAGYGYGTQNEAPDSIFSVPSPVAVARGLTAEPNITTPVSREDIDRAVAQALAAERAEDVSNVEEGGVPTATQEAIDRALAAARVASINVEEMGVPSRNMGIEAARQAISQAAAREAEEVDVAGPNMSAARAAMAAQAALAAQEFGVPGPNMAAAQQAAQAQAARNATAELETAVNPTTMQAMPALNPELAAALEMEELAAAIPEDVAEDTPDPQTAAANMAALQGWAATLSQSEQGFGDPTGTMAVDPTVQAVRNLLGIPPNVPAWSPQFQQAVRDAIRSGRVTAGQLRNIIERNAPASAARGRAMEQRSRELQQQRQQQQQQRQQQQNEPAPTPTPSIAPRAGFGIGMGLEPTQTSSVGSGMSGPPDAKAGANIPGLIGPETRGWSGRSRVSPDLEAVGPDFGPSSGGSAGGGNSGGNSGGGVGGGRGGSSGGGLGGGLGPSGSTGGTGGPGGGPAGNAPAGVAGNEEGQAPSTSLGLGLGLGSLGPASPESPSSAPEAPSETSEDSTTASSVSPDFSADVGLGNSPVGMAPSLGYGVESEDTTADDPDGGIPSRSFEDIAAVPMSFAPMSFFDPMAPMSITPLSNVNPPGMPAYASFRAAQEQGIESEEAEESEDQQGLENSFSNAFSAPNDFGPMGGMASGLAGTSLGAAPAGMEGLGMSAPADVGGAFGGVGLGTAATETSAGQMSSLGLEGMFSNAFADPMGFAAPGFDVSSFSSETDDAESSGLGGLGVGPSDVGTSDTSASAASDSSSDSSSSDSGGAGAGDGGGGGGGSGDGTSGDPGSSGGFDGTSAGGYDSGTSSGGFDGSSDTGGAGWASGGYIDDRAILRAILAAERLHSRDRKARGGYVMPFARFADGGEIVENSVEYTPNGVIYSQVVQRALSAAKRRNAA